MSIPKYLLLMTVAFAVSACQSLPSSPFGARSEKLERVGILQAVNCGQASSCAPYHLLGPQMKSRTALTGKVPQEMTGQLIAVLGRSGDSQRGIETIHVRKALAITSFDYQSFLSQAVALHIEKNYHCTSFWDRGYAWRLEGKQPIILATLSHPDKQKVRQLNLAFDGLNQALISEHKNPIDLDPCLSN